MPWSPPSLDYVTPYVPTVTPKPCGPVNSFSHPIQTTLTDAIFSKYSAASFGYFKDPYLKYFVHTFERRSPLLNRGYYSRVEAMRMVVLNFLDFAPAGDVQVVQLGAGFDTTFWFVNDLLKEQKMEGRASRATKFFELDYGKVTQAKSSIITSHAALNEDLQNIVVDETGFNSDSYALISHDLTADYDALLQKLLSKGFKKEKPTLFLSECFLIYLDSDDGDRLLEWCSTLSDFGIMAVYEQIRPHDSFGQVMCDHLSRMNCPLRSLMKYPNITDQRERFLGRGWNLFAGQDMNHIYDNCIDRSDLLRIQALELFDEIEEWRLIQSHYACCVAVKHTEDTKDYALDFEKIWDTRGVKEPTFSLKQVQDMSSQKSLLSHATLVCSTKEQEVRTERLAASASYRSLTSNNCGGNPNSLSSLHSPMPSYSYQDLAVLNRNVPDISYDRTKESHPSLPGGTTPGAPMLDSPM